MHPSAPDLTPDPAPASCPAARSQHPMVDAVGFQIGWDLAQHGLAPQPELLQAGTAVDQGWRAARAVLGHRTPRTTHALRQWLVLRATAWREGVDFDTEGLCATALARLQTPQCPVRRQQLGGATGGADAPVALRLNAARGYRKGNVVMLSRAAAQAGQGCSVQRALRQARAAEAGGLPLEGLHGAEWLRLAVLLSFGQALSLHEAARLPLLVLPPPGTAPSSPAQALQLQLTLNFRHAGWSSRARQLAAALPQEAQRTDFHLFNSALASRVLAGGTDPLPDGFAPPRLEDAWLNERVQQRWQQLVLGLGDAASSALCQLARELLLPTEGRVRRPAQARAGASPARQPWPEAVGVGAAKAVTRASAVDSPQAWRGRPLISTPGAGEAPRWPRPKGRSAAPMVMPARARP